jgi:hypothetical protein
MSSTLKTPVLTTLPGTQVKEWETATATTLKHEAQSGESTPGPDIPGAFPALDEPSADSTSGQGVGDTVMDTARQYLPQSVVNTMETYIGRSSWSPVLAIYSVDIESI